MVFSLSASDPEELQIVSEFRKCGGRVILSFLLGTPGLDSRRAYVVVRFGGKGVLMMVMRWVIFVCVSDFLVRKGGVVLFQWIGSI